MDVKHEFYQSDATANVSLLVKNTKAELTRVTYEPNAILVEGTTADGKPFAVALTLFASIDPARCSCAHTPYKIELRLAKERAGQWPTLTKSAGAAAPPPAAAATGGEAPVTKLAPPYASKKNWGAVEKDLLKDMPAPSGEEALPALLQDIYKNADEDTRRAMIKSYQTSGGTVLTTNWKDAEKADYEKTRRAPKGQVWKNWEGQVIADDSDDPAADVLKS